MTSLRDPSPEQRRRTILVSLRLAGERIEAEKRIIARLEAELAKLPNADTREGQGEAGAGAEDQTLLGEPQAPHGPDAEAWQVLKRRLFAAFAAPIDPAGRLPRQRPAYQVGDELVRVDEDGSARYRTRIVGHLGRRYEVGKNLEVGSTPYTKEELDRYFRRVPNADTGRGIERAEGDSGGQSSTEPSSAMRSPAWAKLMTDIEDPPPGGGKS